MTKYKQKRNSSERRNPIVFTDQLHFQYPFDELVEFAEDLILPDYP